MNNQTLVTEFILGGFSSNPKMQSFFLGLFSIIYIITLLGNLVIFSLICLDPHLHTPMYFFLSNLSVLDICYSSSTIFHLLSNFLFQRRTISLVGCAAQMYLFLVLATTECILLSVMAYDRYVAICLPLNYTVIMNQRTRVTLAMVSWGSGLVVPVPFTVLTWRLPFCGPNVINHFFCEMPALWRLACSDTQPIELTTQVGSLFSLLAPIIFIFVSYVHILAAILKINYSGGRQKAFSTCFSHLVVVALFYGTAFFRYIQPMSLRTPVLNKVISLFYTVLTPMLNPIIYSLRNREVKMALVKMLRNVSFPQATECGVFKGT
ncbi:olfactory receptor 2A12-like [Alligator mississippiensis]|uniref:olfactory receptor 2A12-like n=1 Tax=Alligator mississippiensis TaxID=8496 RepID=UPI002877F7D6|nr:olfactory receptor 2A12-like [Alligator mississippiensis]